MIGARFLCAIIFLRSGLAIRRIARPTENSAQSTGSAWKNLSEGSLSGIPDKDAEAPLEHGTGLALGVWKWDFENSLFNSSDAVYIDVFEFQYGQSWVNFDLGERTVIGGDRMKFTDESQWLLLQYQRRTYIDRWIRSGFHVELGDGAACSETGCIREMFIEENQRHLRAWVCPPNSSSWSFWCDWVLTQEGFTSVVEPSAEQVWDEHVASFLQRDVSSIGAGYASGYAAEGSLPAFFKFFKNGNLQKSSFGPPSDVYTQLLQRLQQSPEVHTLALADGARQDFKMASLVWSSGISGIDLVMESYFLCPVIEPEVPNGVRAIKRWRIKGHVVNVDDTRAAGHEAFGAGVTPPTDSAIEEGGSGHDGTVGAAAWLEHFISKDYSALLADYDSHAPVQFFTDGGGTPMRKADLGGLYEELLGDPIPGDLEWVRYSNNFVGSFINGDRLALIITAIPGRYYSIILTSDLYTDPILAQFLAAKWKVPLP